MPAALLFGSGLLGPVRVSPLMTWQLLRIKLATGKKKNCARVGCFSPIVKKTLLGARWRRCLTWSDRGLT